MSDEAQATLQRLRGDGSKGTLVEFPWEGLIAALDEAFTAGANARQQAIVEWLRSDEPLLAMGFAEGPEFADYIESLDWSAPGTEEK